MRSSLWVSILALASTATAYWHNNINYRSPSLNHPGLGLAVHKVNKRNTLNKRFEASQLNFTHGVASGDPYHDSVILWTRIAPMYDSVDSNVTVSGYVPLYWHGPKLVSTAPACVEYEVSSATAIARQDDVKTCAKLVHNRRSQNRRTSQMWSAAVKRTHHQILTGL